jgi:hypothetical protein
MFFHNQALSFDKDQRLELYLAEATLWWALPVE